MTILKDISAIWALLHTLVLFVILFESRVPRKKTMAVIGATMIPLILINFVLFLVVGGQKFGILLLASCTVPSMIVFWFLAKYRDGRFFFTFCMVDTLSLEILYITQILDYYISNETHLFMFVVRMAAFPLLEVFFYKKLRPMYLEVQTYTLRGWYIFAAVGMIFYVALTLALNYPTAIVQRPEYLPLCVLLFLLMPVLYANILFTLWHQRKLHEMAEQDNLLRMQVANLTSRMEELNEADEKFRIERHNIRHTLQTIAGMAEKAQYDELQQFVQQYTETIRETQVQRYCADAVLDAVLSSYLRRAESKGIRVTVGLHFPEELPVNDAELAAVFANAIENAVDACEKLPPEQRYLDIKVLTAPRFMIQVRNSCAGPVPLDENGIPASVRPGHGLGTRSIIAFCKKNSAFYEFKSEAAAFSLRIVF